MPYQEKEPGVRDNTRELMRLQDVHYHIIRMTAAGLKPQAISEMLSISLQTVYNTLGTELAQKELARYRKDADEMFMDVQERLQAISPHMLDVLVAAALDPAEKTQLRTSIADKLLDKAGHKPISKVVKVDDDKIDPEFIAQVKKRAAELRNLRQKRLYEEANYEEV